MTALSQDRDTLRREATGLDIPTAANVRVFGGAMVGINAAGLAVPAGANATRVLGTAITRVDNTGGIDGGPRARIDKRVACMSNSEGASAITLADVGKPCYAVDDQTVTKTEGPCVAGKVFDVDANGVWVDFR